MNRFSSCPDPRTVTTWSNTCYNFVIVFSSPWLLHVTSVMKVTSYLSGGVMLNKALKKLPIVVAVLLPKILVNLVRLLDVEKNNFLQSWFMTAVKMLKMLSFHWSVFLN